MTKSTIKENLAVLILTIALICGLKAITIKIDSLAGPLPYQWTENDLKGPYVEKGEK